MIPKIIEEITEYLKTAEFSLSNEFDDGRYVFKMHYCQIRLGNII